MHTANKKVTNEPNNNNITDNTTQIKNNSMWVQTSMDGMQIAHFRTCTLQIMNK